MCWRVDRQGHISKETVEPLGDIPSGFLLPPETKGGIVFEDACLRPLEFSPKRASASNSSTRMQNRYAVLPELL